MKHLDSRDRIHRFLELLNCRYADGRAEAAPQMRRELGTSKGEGLCHLDGEAINDFCGHTATWHGGVFPTITLDGI